MIAVTGGPWRLGRPAGTGGCRGDHSQQIDPIPIQQQRSISRLSTAIPRHRVSGPRRQMELPAPCGSTEEKSPNLMPAEITGAEALDPGHLQAPGSAPVGLWSLTVEAA